MYFIDIHSHLLPGVDDGSESLAESLEMARQAAADNVGIMVCTPHCKPGVYDMSVAEIYAAVDRLREALARENIELALAAGGDVHLTFDMAARLESGRAPTLAGGKYFLLEPPHEICPPGVERAVEKVIERGYTPIITHPERYRWIEAKMGVMWTLREMGCLFQITAASLTGRFGRDALRWSEYFLKEGMGDVIASDAHHARDRRPGLSAARDVAAQWVGRALADRMVSHIPFAILRGHPPETIALIRTASA